MIRLKDNFITFTNHVSPITPSVGGYVGSAIPYNDTSIFRCDTQQHNHSKHASNVTNTVSQTADPSMRRGQGSVRLRVTPIVDSPAE